MSAELLLLFAWASGTPEPDPDPDPEPEPEPATLGASFDDTISLGGQRFAVKGPLRANAVSEFETGVKIGPATYDQREHAFFLVLNDFSGGLGHRRLELRDELGTFWDSNAANSPDTRRAGHITLPMAQTTVTPTALVANNMNFGHPSQALMFEFGVQWLIGVGSDIYSSSDGTTFTKLHTGQSGAYVQSIVGYNAYDGSTGYTYYLYAFFYHIGNSYASSTARYKRSLPASSGGAGTWGNGTENHVLTDGIVWDKKLVAANGDRIIYAVLNSVTGTELWNIDDPADGEAITQLEGARGRIRFVGIAEAPWGDPAVYFIDEVNLYVLDFFNRTHYPISLGAKRPILAHCLWNGQVCVTDGWNVLAFSPASQTVRNIGFPRKAGTPPSLQATGGGTYLITAMFPSDEYLYVIVSHPTLAISRLFCYTGVGWSQVGEDMAGYANFAGQAYYPVLGIPTTSRVIHVPVMSTPTATDLTMYNFSLPNLHHVPNVGVDQFGASGAHLTTGWIDGGFNDIEGTLLRMSIDAFHLTTNEKVRIEYQLDNDEDSAWTQMVDTADADTDFSSTVETLYFSSSFPKRGIQFRTVRFRITLLRGGTATLSPELRALTLIYLKTPNIRTAWSFEIDINRMIEKSATGNDETFYVDGSPATMSRVWAKLRSLWNTQTLLPFIVPNVEPSPGIDVRLNDIPITFDDFRDAGDGQGSVAIQVIEPVARVS